MARRPFIVVTLLLSCACTATAAVAPAPARDEGEGPFPQLILRGVTVVTGTGAPAYGPVDIVIEGDRIVDVAIVGTANHPIRDDARPKLAPGGREMDLAGHYVLPGLIDMHGHIGGAEQGVDAEYVYKLWLGHGITTIREPGCGNGIDWCVSEAKRSDASAIAAPRIFPYAFFGMGREGPFTTPAQAREWVRAMKARGAVGMKCFGYRPDILEAAFDELKKQGMRSACHHAQLDVSRVDVLTTARWGLTTMEHWYGLPEALFDGQTVQAYPADYNFLDEQHRFGEAGRLWAQASPKGSERYEQVMRELLDLDFTLDPTFTIYQATRDLMRARNADWHAEYTHPALWTFFTPNRGNHGSFFFDWGSEQETAWKQNYRLWMAFVNDYKNRGGRVTVGSDSGFIYKTYGYGTNWSCCARPASTRWKWSARRRWRAPRRSARPTASVRSKPASSPTCWSSPRTRSRTSRCSTAPATRGSAPTARCSASAACAGRSAAASSTTRRRCSPTCAASSPTRKKTAAPERRSRSEPPPAVAGPRGQSFCTPTVRVTPLTVIVSDAVVAEVKLSDALPTDVNVRSAGLNDVLHGWFARDSTTSPVRTSVALQPPPSSYHFATPFAS